MITIFYFVLNPKYRCPKCKSTFIGVKNKKGIFVGNKVGFGRALKIVVLTLLIIVVIGILSIIIATPIQKAKKADTSSWFNYVSPEDPFSILLPSYPTLEKKETQPIDASSLTYHQYQSTDGQTSYFIFKYAHSEKLEIKDGDKLLNTYLDQMLKTTNSTIASSSFSYFSGYRTLDFSFDTKGETLRGRFVLVGENPYLLTVDYYPANYSEEKYNKFINSFSVQ